MSRRLQLAERLADLYDQYQVYRSDWLAAWAAGDDVLAPARRRRPAARPIPPDQRWQPALWRELLAPLSEADRKATRPQLHRRFLDALESGARPKTPVPRRIVLFGTTHVPMQTLQALAALSQYSQVLLAIPNPCRFHWADVIQGRELLRIDRRRHPLRNGRDLAAVALEEMHAHAHPLLVAWGRQGRDFVRQLDAFDDALAAQERFALAKIDLFNEEPGQTLLAQVQARIRDLVPLAEHAALIDAAARRQRPLDRLSHRAWRAARGRDPARPAAGTAGPSAAGAGDRSARHGGDGAGHRGLRAGRSARSSGSTTAAIARHIPFDIADLQERGNNPLLVAVEWLLRLPMQRCRAERSARPAGRAGDCGALRPRCRRHAAAGAVAGRRGRALGPASGAAR